MSHFTVMLKITPERLARHDGDLDATIAEMMAPYCEQTEDPRFLKFKDTEDEECRLRDRLAEKIKENKAAKLPLIIDP